MLISADTGIAATVVVVLLLNGVMPRQRPENRLGAVKSVSCTFPLFTRATWSSGTPEATVQKGDLLIRFDEINLDDGTARVLGNFGPSDIIVRLAGDTLHLIQAFREGPLYVTTIFSKETRTRRLQAVHTRHEFTEVSLPGFTSRPEQYYGDCELQP